MSAPLSDPRMANDVTRRTHACRAARLLDSLSAPGGCLTQARVTEHEDKLGGAGFIVHPGNTTERRAMLKRLPPDRLVMRTAGDIVSFLYPGPLLGGCLYVGTQQT